MVLCNKITVILIAAVFDELLCSPVSSTAKVLHEKNDAVLDLMDAPTSIGDRVRLRADCCANESNCRS